MKMCSRYIQILLFSLAVLRVIADEEREEISTTTTTEAPKIPCDGKGMVCVASRQCIKGFVDGNTLERNYNYTKLCNATEVCCELAKFDPKNADKCAVRNNNTFPRGPLPINANFAEFPWQAMILKESTKSLLCGGIIISKNFVLTSGSCVAGQRYTDVLTKGGEWELGKNSEGIDFQLVRLKTMTFHPDFNFTDLSTNLALLHLERDYKFDVHIQQLCFDDTQTDPQPGDYCIVTGWGKEALATHKSGAIEHYTEVEILDEKNCTLAAGIRNYNPDVSICAKSSTDACEFDFGSALACRKSPTSNEFVLKGIYTHNTGCQSWKPTLVFSRNNPDWIKSVLKGEKTY